MYSSEKTLKCHHTKKHGKDPEWTTYECEGCGVQVGHYSGANDRASQFCRGCYQDDRSADTIDVKCKTCGAVEWVPKYLDDRRFCSPDCRAEWVSEEMVGENHPNWKGGKSQYRGANWDEQREKALSRDGYKCRVCEDEEQLIVHHIVSFHEFDEVRKANDLENLATLCRSCHGYLEGWINREGLDGQGQKMAFRLAEAQTRSTSV